MMNLSYWEYKTWLSNIDYTIVGSGIVGLNTALQLKKRFPQAKVLVLEKGILPQGASTKNAGFACFGSISEILSDLKKHTEEEVLQLVQNRWEGIQLLRANLGDKTIGYRNLGGHEVFLKEHQELYQECQSQLPRVNSLLKAVFKTEAFKVEDNIFNFKGIQQQYITSTVEGQIDTGKMMESLVAKVQQSGVTILNAITVESFTENSSHVSVKTNCFEFITKNLLLATNGFAAELIAENVKPSRAQVIITKPIPDLKIKGTFHLDEGYYYFRNIDDRILLGGGRNLNFKEEETAAFGLTPLIQNSLEEILATVILPSIPFEIDRRWSGIMGTGTHKRPIVKPLSDRVFCGVRMGGMGIAIGSLVGRNLADLV